MDQDKHPDPNLAAELRQTAGAEWMAAAAEDEQLTELMRRRRMKLSDIAKELANRGDRVTADFGGHTFGGVAVGAGDDFMTISGSGQIAEVLLNTAQWTTLTAEGQESQRVEVVESFRALLHQHAEAQGMLRVCLDRGDILIGKIAVVGEDHLEVVDADDRSVYVPIDLVMGLIRSSGFH